MEYGPTYNLEVEDCPEFFANGILVHNCAFWRDENSATPDIETYRAVIPGMSTVPNSMLIGISSPHKESGLLFDKYDRHFGNSDNPDILVINAGTRLMNPMIDIIDPGLIDKALEDDPELANAEYFALFRKDLADFVTREVLLSCIMKDVQQIPPDETLRTNYSSFTDPSGGVRDSYTCSIGHFDTRQGRAVQDCLVEIRAPFDPEQATDVIADKMKEYRVTRTTGDKYAGNWVVEQFAKRGIVYEQSEVPKSDIYREWLPVLNSGRCALLDNSRLYNQTLALERRTIRGGRDTVDHPQGGRDDVANCTAGNMVQLAGDDRMAVVRRYLGA